MIEIGSFEDVECILIAGPTCSGKTTLAELIKSKMSVGTLISLDNYFLNERDLPIISDAQGLKFRQWDAPDCYDWKRFSDDIETLLMLQRAKLRRFCHEKNEEDGSHDTLLEFPLIIEGLYTFNEVVVECIIKHRLSMKKIYITAPPVTRQERRIQRNRFESVERIHAKFPLILSAEQKWLEEQRKLGDIILENI